ncbi:MAG: glycosyltransferase family 2 protein, partial [Gemmatimonadota bacterium]
MTPSYNQGRFLEETIRSVLLQGYPNLEYMVIDGGSTDSSVQIIRRYEGWLSYSVSEQDQGQADAINKGFARATGEIHGYLNSDDAYLPNVLARVAEGFRENPTGLHAYPVVDVDDEGSSEIRSVPLHRRRSMTTASHSDHAHPPPDGAVWRDSLVPLITGELYLHQPGVFWPALSYFEADGFDESYSFMFDQKFFLELVLAGQPLICHGGDPVARFRYHDDSKTVVSKRKVTNPFSLELWRIARQLEPRLKKGEREVVRQKRIAMALSRVWRELRSGSGRRRA